MNDVADAIAPCFTRTYCHCLNNFTKSQNFHPQDRGQTVNCELSIYSNTRQCGNTIDREPVLSLKLDLQSPLQHSAMHGEVSEVVNFLSASLFIFLSGLSQGDLKFSFRTYMRVLVFLTTYLYSCMLKVKAVNRTPKEKKTQAQNKRKKKKRTPPRSLNFQTLPDALFFF